MNEIGLPREWSDDYWRLHRKLQSSGESVDAEFIRHGFVVIQALIDRLESLAGGGSYHQLLRMKTNPREFEEFRNQNSEELRRLSGEQARLGRVNENEWDKILSSPRLHGGSKIQLLSRFFPDRFREYSASVESRLKEAADEEARRVCKLCVGHGEPLLADLAIELRKKVCNEVMADAYGRLGFQRRGRKGGIDAYQKPLTKNHSIIVKLDSFQLNRAIEPLIDCPPSALRLPLDGLTYIGSSAKSDKRCWFVFSPIDNCLATIHGISYRDTRSLEVAIRARALWYELMISPFEAIVRA